jgi:hypothetical protein
MKNFIKSVVFAVAMLLAVSVQAENKPENAMRTNPETVATLKTTEPNDVQQTPCSIALWTTCGITANLYFPDTNGVPCQILGALYGMYYQSLC